MIVPHLRPYPEDNSVLVIDNCTVHKNDLAVLVAMVEAEGAKIRFLAPYCPINNPIECAFSSFKACWRRHGHWLLPCTSKSSFALFTAVRTAKLPWPPTGRVRIL
jgi:transposase